MKKNTSEKLLACLKRARIKREQKYKQRIKNYNENPIRCKNCKKPISYKNKKRQKFCSHSCSATFNNKGVRRNGDKPGNCLSCNIKLNSSYAKYCSQKCCNDHKYEIYIDKWLSGLENGIIGKEDVSSRIRKYLFNKYNNKCQDCGWSKINLITGKVPLCIHHLNGDYKDNKEENLQLLCPNCHSLTPNYGILNNGNGREIRQIKRKLK